jgi:hypothetical protein
MPVSNQGERASPRVSVQRQWWVREARAIEPAVEQLARAHAMIAAYDRGAVVLRGGSDTTSGAGAFISDRELPKRGRLERWDTQDRFTLVRLQLEDALDPALMDTWLQSRYADLLERIAHDVAAGLAARTEVYDVGQHRMRGDG